MRGWGGDKRIDKESGRRGKERRNVRRGVRIDARECGRCKKRECERGEM